MQSNEVQNGSCSRGVIFSLLDTDLYKLTMQYAVWKYFPDVEVTYNFTNRTPDMKLSRAAFLWLQAQTNSMVPIETSQVPMKSSLTPIELGNTTLSSDELGFLQRSCPYLEQKYIDYLSTFRLDPLRQITMSFLPVGNGDKDEDLGEVMLGVRGLWVETILYEVPLLALTSEAYFRFCDRAWSYDGQEDNAYKKGISLLRHGCRFSEFGTRRRRDYHTQDLVMEGLCRAAEDRVGQDRKGRLLGTSNVHFAHKYGITPVGTVAHEWFMGIAAVTDDYANASEIALQCWVGCFGEGVLGITLTDTFGTPAFLNSFKKPLNISELGGFRALASANESTTSSKKADENTDSRVKSEKRPRTYAEVYTGVRQDSGDPAGFVRTMRQFYDSIGVEDKKTIVFSDSLNIDLCLKYMSEAENSGFDSTFGVGTYLTNDFVNSCTGEKSVPLNIVIKLSSAAGRPTVKISDSIGKNTGNPHAVEKVKRILGYVEQDWKGGDETARWGTASGSSGSGSSNSPESAMDYNSGRGGREANPYDQRGGQEGYGYGNRYDEDQGGRYGRNDVEMAPLNGQAFARDPNAILNECREIDRGIDSIESNLERLRFLQTRSLDDPDASQNTATNRELDALSSETMTLYRNFAQRIKTIKSQPDSGSPRNAPQVGKIDRKLKSAINQYQNVEADFRKKLQAQMERQYRIVRPDASDAEVREACSDTSNQQVFSQALLQSDRRGQAQSALRAVESRHQAIQKIEQQMIELAQLFQDMEALVVQQGAAVEVIEQQGTETVDNVGQANVEINGAIEKARSRNRKKWWCLLIVSK
ncbi:MAG: nicotinate phosphoribosyltransferase [Trichoglossum hirsutum]|nr:MAG: nicotinate phosphoribosyltransferase [Trichoglossum hirsutum]